MREVLGVVRLDLPRYLRELRRGASLENASRRPGWTHLCNRHEKLITNPSGPGVICDWVWTSELHACCVIPRLGMKVMQAALTEWPIHLREDLPCCDVPEISFIIPHRSAERWPLLLATLQSIFAQKHVSIECIVVEQSAVTEIPRLPHNVRLIRLVHPDDPTGWYKSWAYNVGVAAARAPIVVCHDGDILVPENYGSELMRLFENPECPVVYPQRFLFYLTRKHAEAVRARGQMNFAFPPERIVQNWKGGTLAIRREAYFQIGGFDETFEGWTGEDVEFHDRCLALEGWNYGYIPFVHLWHAPQAAKYSTQRESNLAYTAQIMRIPREERILKLKQRQAWCDDPSRPHPVPVRGEPDRMSSEPSDFELTVAG